MPQTAHHTRVNWRKITNKCTRIVYLSLQCIYLSHRHVQLFLSHHQGACYMVQCNVHVFKIRLFTLVLFSYNFVMCDVCMCVRARGRVRTCVYPCLFNMQLVCAILWRQTDGRTDMTKLIVAFRNFANAPAKSKEQPRFLVFPHARLYLSSTKVTCVWKVSFGTLAKYTSHGNAITMTKKNI